MSLAYWRHLEVFVFVFLGMGKTTISEKYWGRTAIFRKFRGKFEILENIGDNLQNGNIERVGVKLQIRKM
jgi:hypothetical protein